MSYNATNNVVESFEDRQWRQKLEEARKRLQEEEDEWNQLVARARNALENEEREWERLRMRSAIKSSGAFPTQSEVRVEGAPSPQRASGASRGTTAFMPRGTPRPWP